MLDHFVQFAAFKEDEIAHELASNVGWSWACFITVFNYLKPQENKHYLKQIKIFNFSLIICH